MSEKRYKVYLSSTLNDLKAEREAVTKALSDECVVKHSYRASEKELIASCLDDVASCDLYIGILGLRYGHIPGQRNRHKRSITELEYRHAVTKKVSRYLFLKDPNEIRAIHTDAHTEENPSKLIKAFRDLAGKEQRPALFDSPQALATEVVKAFNAFKATRAQESPRKAERAQRDTKISTEASVRAAYLQSLSEHCEKIVLLGLDTRERHPVRLGQVYVPALTAAKANEKANTLASLSRIGRERYDLVLDRIGQTSVYLPGAPGSGKSTFCRWLALCTARGDVPTHEIDTPAAFRERLPRTLRNRLPVLVELRSWAGDRDRLRGRGDWQRKQLEESLAGWLDSATPGMGRLLQHEIERGKALLILDGVDEIPEVIESDRPRRNFLTGVANALPAWHRAGNRIVLTSRPYGVEPAQRQRLELEIADLEGLPHELQWLFVHRWYAAAGTQDARDKAQGLIDHLDGRPDLDELRPNPMLLTALCVKYDEGQRLPRDLYRLYDSVVDKVLYKRFDTETQRDLARLRLSAIALTMHLGPNGNRITPEAEVPFGELDDGLRALARTDYASEEQGTLDASERREHLLSDSGLLLPKGDKRAGFYHLSFQEFLAATRLRRTRADVRDLLTKHASTPAWRRSLRFLFCAIADQESNEAALEAFEPLLDVLNPSELERDPNSALLLADCLEVGHAREWNLSRYEQPLLDACKHAVDHVEPPARAHLWRVLGTMGLDRRSGVGLTKDSLPDIDWAEIPGGAFLFGEKRRRANVARFRIARFPVTNAQFQAFVDDGGFENASWWQWPDQRRPPWRPRWNYPNHPRETVSWFDAMAFCRWLQARSRERGLIDENTEIRLPTELEYERAARGTDGRGYPWGDEYQPGFANIDETHGEAGPDYLERTSAVGIYPRGASLEGVLDLAGNVWEWNLDKYDPKEKGENAPRVLRGGSWLNSLDGARASNRGNLVPDNRNLNIGFRVVCVSPIR